MSTSSTWSARRTTSSGTVSRCGTPVICSTTSLSDSRCWMLTVEMTSMPASSSSSMSCQRLALREPGTLVWASSSTSATSGLRARTASTSISVKVGAAVGHRPARDDLQVRRAARRCGRGRGSRRSRRPRRCRARRGGAPRRASRRSCRRPGRPRGRSAAARASSSLRSGPLGAAVRSAVGPGTARSRARLSSSTLTAGSPMKPRARPVGVLVDQLLAPGRRAMPRSRATRAPAGRRTPG